MQGCDNLERREKSRLYKKNQGEVGGLSEGGVLPPALKAGDLDGLGNG